MAQPKKTNNPLIKTPTIYMSVDDWIDVKDCEIQRDTMKHAKRTTRPNGHLAKYDEAHRYVTMAQLPNGKYIKLDGHTRALLWSLEELERPKGMPTNRQLIVTVIQCKDQADIRHWYGTFDNKRATESNRDLLDGALGYHKIDLKHGYLFQNTGLMSAIQYTIWPEKWVDLQTINFIDLTRPWLDAIRTMDSGEFPNHLLFRSPVLLAALMSFRRDGNRALSFWEGFHNDIGIKDKKGVDAIFCARDCLTIATNEQGGRWGRRMFSVYTPYFLYLYDLWWNGEGKERMKKFRGIQGKKMPQGMITVRDWWVTHLGELDQPQIRKPKEEDSPQLELV